MDWVTVAIGLGVCLITALVLYLISVYSFKVTTLLIVIIAGRVSC